MKRKVYIIETSELGENNYWECDKTWWTKKDEPK